MNPNSSTFKQNILPVAASLFPSNGRLTSGGAMKQRHSDTS